MILEIAKKIVPDNIKNFIKRKRQEKLKALISSLPKLSEENFRNIIIDKLGLKNGDIICIHSSVDRLNLDFPSYKIINILLEIVGESGTILFPTYPKLNSYLTLKNGEIFNIKRSPSFTGILSEYARRHSRAIRSLHPTKSVVAIGPLTKELTDGHENSPYPYDTCSPYYKLREYNAKIIGIGVKTTYLSAVHTVDDTMRDIFPLNPYHKELFEAECINYSGDKIIVKTYAHYMKYMNFDLPDFFKKNVPKEICEDINIDGMSFFRADAKPMYDYMVNLLKEKKITIYKY
jgi:aminoglycoside 3-N-acetyltransferase